MSCYRRASRAGPPLLLGGEHLRDAPRVGDQDEDDLVRGLGRHGAARAVGGRARRGLLGPAETDRHGVGPARGAVGGHRNLLDPRHGGLQIRDRLAAVPQRRQHLLVRLRRRGPGHRRRREGRWVARLQGPVAGRAQGGDDRDQVGRKLAALLKKQCAELKKAEEGLEQAREVEKKEILRQKELLLKDIQDNDYILSKNTGTLESLQKLSFDNWESAEKARDKAYNEAKNIINEIEKWEERKNTAAREVAAIKAKISTMEETFEKQCADEEELSKKLQDLLNQYDFDSLEEIREFTLSEEDISGKEDLIAKFNERVSVNESKLIQAREDAEGKRKVDIKELEESVEVKNNEAALMRSMVSAISFKIDSNNEKYKNIKEQGIELEKFSKEYNICKRLYNLVKGQTGNGKITLEQYVQAAGFDAIIRAANRRLLPMSEGQYELYRTKDALGKRSNTFLDLEALDNYTGHRRPVGNLSGGESFKASLSLALGLSDTVSSNLGGVQMDALFIDEGFGTLDKKSIENAMDILLSLSGTNKLVGIISHREELKDNIPQKILIEKTREGSDIRVERD